MKVRGGQNCLVEGDAVEVVREGVTMVWAPKAACRVLEAEPGISAPGVGPGFRLKPMEGERLAVILEIELI